MLRAQVVNDALQDLQVLSRASVVLCTLKCKLTLFRHQLTC